MLTVGLTPAGYLHRLCEPPDIADVETSVVAEALLDERQKLPLACELHPETQRVVPSLKLRHKSSVRGWPAVGIHLLADGKRDRR